MEREISLREHQLIMLNILEEFALFCDNNGLKYFLDAGTLLGAVRHSGFIPWDNDVDVCMPRSDFNKFFKLLEKKHFMLNEYIVLERPENTIYTFFKLGDIRTKLIEFPDRNPIECFIYIDVFVKDGIPNNNIKAKRVCKKNERLSLLHWFNKYSIIRWKKQRNIIKKLIANIANILVKDKNRAYYKQKEYIEKINLKYPYDSCDYVTTLSNGEYFRRCKKTVFEEFEMHIFENKYFKIPKEYDTWLRVLYGNDYMKPPINKPLSHNVITSWR